MYFAQQEKKYFVMYHVFYSNLISSSHIIYL